MEQAFSTIVFPVSITVQRLEDALAFSDATRFPQPQVQLVVDFSEHFATRDLVSFYKSRKYLENPFLTCAMKKRDEQGGSKRKMYAKFHAGITSIERSLQIFERYLFVILAVLPPKLDFHSDRLMNVIEATGLHIGDSIQFVSSKDWDET